jgi:hypothetical protein
MLDTGTLTFSLEELALNYSSENKNMEYRALKDCGTYIHRLLFL